MNKVYNDKTPKTPIEKIIGDYIKQTVYECPVCKAYVFEGHDESCAKCGQPIDWGNDTQENKIYTYYANFYDDTVVGIVEARNLLEAEEFLRKTYSDYNEWDNKILKEVKFNKNNVCELYYGY